MRKTHRIKIPCINKSYLLAACCISALFLPVSALSMGEKQQRDPACFVSDDLRLQVGGRITFSIPRKQISSITYSPDSPHYMPSTSARNLCQRFEDAAVPVLGVSLKTYPQNEQLLRKGKDGCAQVGVVTSIGLTSWARNIKNIPVKFSLKEIQKQCDRSRYHDSCEGGWRYRGLEMRVFYYPSCYPPQDWSETAKFITNYLDQLIIQGK